MGFRTSDPQRNMMGQSSIEMFNILVYINIYTYLVIQFLNAATHPLLGSGCCAHKLLCLFSQRLKLLRSQFVEDTLELAIQVLQVHVVSMEIYHC